jgi:shikimate 5-dehydrogenase
MKFGLIMKDGKDMLVGQAVHAWMHFTGETAHDRIKKIMDRAIEL